MSCLPAKLASAIMFPVAPLTAPGNQDKLEPMCDAGEGRVTKCNWYLRQAKVSAESIAKAEETKEKDSQGDQIA
eukprot:867304-Pyramimonas_sp.AAC.1